MPWRGFWSVFLQKYPPINQINQIKFAEMIKVALDWVPNANHVGILLAALELDGTDGTEFVEFVSPHQTSYEKTPHQLVRAGEADIGIGPSESVISSFIEHGQDGIVAIAALIVSDDSAIVTLKSSGIDTMAKLDGKRYASYSARFEGRIVQSMIKHAGGAGVYEELSPEKLGVFDTLLDGSYDATWIFCHHEGVIAKRKGVELNVFKLEDHGVPYGYPLVLFKSRARTDNDDAIRSFIRRAQRWYEWAARPENQVEAAERMTSKISSLFPDLEIDHEQLKESVSLAAETFCDAEGRACRMEEGKWAGFVDWLYDAGLMTTKMQSRGPASATKTSLDGLRGGDAGDRLPRNAVRAADLFTSSFTDGLTG